MYKWCTSGNNLGTWIYQTIFFQKSIYIHPIFCRYRKIMAILLVIHSELTNNLEIKGGKIIF